MIAIDTASHESVIAQSASEVTWPSEDADIAGALEMIRDPNMPPAAADRMIRSLIAIAKTAAFGAGTLRGVNLGEKVALEAIKAVTARRSA